jgi:hypothetical protein
MRILSGDAAADRGGTLDVLKQMHRTKVIHYLPVLLLSVVGASTPSYVICLTTYSPLS